KTFIPLRASSCCLNFRAGATILVASPAGAVGCFETAVQEEKFSKEKKTRRESRWAAAKNFLGRERIDKTKILCLYELNYTSGRAHIGHVSNYAIGDALAWYKRMRGFNVLHPFGWDAFGQPAETAAIKEGIDPGQFTRDAIATMKAQLMRIGLSYDWSREV